MKDKQVRARYTPEFKLEAVVQMRTGQAIGVAARALGIPRMPARGSGCEPRSRTICQASQEVTKTAKVSTALAHPLGLALESGPAQFSSV